MESHKIWIANLQDILQNHICNGLLKTYDEILRLCGGHKLKLSIQTAMEGIANLSSHKVNADFRILLESLTRIGFTEKNLNDLIQNSYASYGLTALRAAGIKCERVETYMLTGPVGSAFIHEVYINVARHIWSKPDILIDKNVPLLKSLIKDAIEQAVRSGINLNALTEAVKTAAEKPLSEKPLTASLTQTLSTPRMSLKERLNKINGSKTLLDIDSDDSDNESHLGGSFRAPPQPSMSGEMTIENDDLAPDNTTITFDNMDEDDDEEGEDDEGDDDEDNDDDDEDDDDEDDDVNALLPVDETKRRTYELELEGDDTDSTIKKDDEVSDTIPSHMFAGEIKLVNVMEANTSASASSPTTAANIQQNRSNFDDSSQYTVTLLSHKDMLSSRLSRLGMSTKK